MSPSDFTLLERWQDRRDAKAFQEIVSRHGAMVFSVCRRILGNSADTEEVAQECFLALAQAEAKNIQILGGWLHTSATHRSLDRVRGDKRRKQRERRYTEANPTQVEPTWNEIQHFVDEVIGELPEELSSVVIGHFLEGRTQADLAQSLKLSPSSISRRIDRAVEQIRTALRKRGVIIAPALLSGMLAKAVAEPVPKSLAAAYGKLALSGAKHVRTGAAPSVSARATASLPAKFGLAAFALVLVAVLGSFFIEKLHADKPIDEGTIAKSTSTAAPTPEDSVPESSTTSNTDEEAKVASTQTEPAASVSGVVVFRGTDEPADGTQVILGTHDQQRYTTVTDLQGAFAFNEVAKGEIVLLAYDARYDEVPEDWLRSEHMGISLEVGETRTNIRIEVPPRGGQISGRVYDEETGAPLRGLRVRSFRVGESGPETVTTGPDGRYTLIGLNEGEWHVQLDNNNPVFSSSTSESIPRAYIRAGETTELDFPVDRSISISGHVVNPEGDPVSKAGINVVLFLNEGMDRRRYGSFYADAQGEFTFWGGFTTERAVFSAAKGEMTSSVAVVKTTPGETLDGVLLTLYPEVKVSGRFTDEHGRPTKAKFWNRPKHPDGDGAWRGTSGEASETFETTMARGDYEIKGQTQNFGVEELTQPLYVGTDVVSNVIIKVQTNSELVGEYSIRGTVVDEQGEPLKRTRPGFPI